MKLVLQTSLALMSLSTRSWPKHQSIQVPLNSEKKLLIPRANRKTLLSEEVPCEGTRDPAGQNPAPYIPNLMIPFAIFTPIPWKKKKKDPRVPTFTGTLGEKHPTFQAPPCHPQTRLFVISEHKPARLRPFLLSPRLPQARGEMQRFVFVSREGVFPRWVSNTGANPCPCQELRRREWLCHAAGAVWVKRGRNSRNTRLHLGCSLVCWNNPMSSFRNCGCYRICTGIKYIKHLQIWSAAGPSLGPPGAEPPSSRRKTSSPRNLSFSPIFSPPTVLI